MVNHVDSSTLLFFLTTALFEIHLTYHTILPFHMYKSMAFTLTDICTHNPIGFRKSLLISPQASIALGNPYPYFLSPQFCLFCAFHINGLFCDCLLSTRCSQDWSLLQHQFFLHLSNTPLYGYDTFYIFILQLIDICVISALGNDE